MLGRSRSNSELEDLGVPELFIQAVESLLPVTSLEGISEINIDF